MEPNTKTAQLTKTSVPIFLYLSGLQCSKINQFLYSRYPDVPNHVKKKGNEKSEKFLIDLWATFSGFGLPQLGQISAFSLCLFPHSVQVTSAILFRQQQYGSFKKNCRYENDSLFWGICHCIATPSQYSFRIFITNLAEKGVSVRVLQSLAGHRNISTTQAYIDVNDAMKRKAVELVQ